VFAGHSDPFSQRALQRWQERLRIEWNVEVFRTRWLDYGYPFSTVESYHGPGFLLWATRKAPADRDAAYHQRVQPERSGSLQPNPEITPEELHRRRTAGESILVVDVRNPNELEICRISGSTHIPIADLPMRLTELDVEREIVVHCKMGGRSSQAAAFLRAQGYQNVRNLTGGILAWIDKVEPGLTKY
jgi:rhodanese-related sulfurtransferase